MKKIDNRGITIFSVSQYGGQTSNGPIWTNNNNSGIKNIGGLTQSTGILDTLTNSNINFTSLFDSSGNPKKYVKQWSINRESNNFVGFSTNSTYGGLGSDKRFTSRTDYPGSIKSSLFRCGICLDQRG